MVAGEIEDSEDVEASVDAWVGAGPDASSVISTLGGQDPRFTVLSKPHSTFLHPLRADDISDVC
jgi:hypothetical protein